MPKIQFDIVTNSQGAITGITAVSGALKAAGAAGQNASTQVVSAFDRMEAVIGKVKSAIIGFSAAFVFTRVIRGIEDIIKAGMDFESTFMEIRKTVDGGVGDFARLSNEMRELAKTMPVAVTELNRIGGVAGQIGVPIDKIKEFVETIAKVGATTAIPVDEAATSFARLANILGLPIEQVKVLASVMFKLDAAFPASTREILEFSMNIAGAARNVGMTAPQIAALSTALASVGLHSEKAGSAMSRVFYEMQKAVVEGGAKLENFAAISQMTTEQFSKAFKADAGNALLAFLSGLKNVKDDGLEMIQVLETLGLKNVRVADVVVRSALAVDVYSKAMRESISEMEKGGKTLDERYSMSITTASDQLKILAGRINDVFIEISNRWSPSIVTAARDLTGLVEKAKDSATQIGALTKVVFDFAGAIALTKLLMWAGNLGVVTSAVTFLGKALAGTLAPMALVNAFIAGVEIIAGVAAFTALAVAIYKLEVATTEASDATRQAAEDQKTFVESTKKAIAALDAQGISINNYIDETGDLQAALGRATKARLDQIKIEQAITAINEVAAVAEAKKAAAVKLVTEATVAQRKRIDDIKNSVLEVGKKDDAWVTAMHELVNAGVPLNAMLMEQGHKVIEYGDRMEVLGEVMLPTIKTLYDLAITQREYKKEVEGSVGILNAELDVIIKKRIQQADLNKTMQDSATILAGIAANNAFKASQSIMDLTGMHGEVAIDEKNTMLSPKDALEAAQNAEKAMKAATKKIADDFDRAFDTVFRKFAEKGKLSSKDVADFFSKAFNSVIDALTEPLRTKFSKAISGLINGKEGEGGILGKLTHNIDKIGDSIGSSLAGIFGGSKGGKLASGLGDVMGGAMSAGIGMAISMGINLVSSLIGKSGSEVNNKLVKDIQNPFMDAVGSMMDSFDALRASGKLTLQSAVDARTNLTALYDKFKTDTAAYAALGAKQSTAVQGAFATLEKYFGKDLKDLFDKIDTSIVELGGNAGMTADDLVALNTALETASRFAGAVKQMVEQVTGAPEQIDVMAAALEELTTKGIPAGVIVDQLGNGILDLADKMKALGIEVPEIIMQFAALTLNTRRLKEVEAELTAVREQTINAINQAMDQNEAAISASIDKIKNWNKQIVDLDKQIGDLSAQLDDASHWQQVYQQAISDAERAYADAVRDRENAEKEIHDITMSIERKRLQAALDAAEKIMNAEKDAKNAQIDTQIAALEKAQHIVDMDNTQSLEARNIQHDALQEQIENLKKGYSDELGDQEAFLAAKKALEDFDNAEKERQANEELERLAKLQASLAGLREAEEARRIELDAAKVAATALVEQEKHDLQTRIAGLQEQRNEIWQSIFAEQIHISTMREQNVVLGQMLDALGGERANNSLIMNINALIVRGQKLEEERSSLVLLTGIAAQGIDVFHGLAQALAALLNVAAGGTGGGVDVPPDYEPGYPPPDEHPSPIPIPPPPTGEGTGHLPPPTPSDISDYGEGGISIFDIFGGHYARGSSYIARDMMAYLHRGERVVPAAENKSGYGSVMFAPGSITINAQPGQNGKQLAQQFVNELKTNGDLRRRVKEIVQ